MKTSPEGVAEIAGHEGIILSPYKDSVGVWTIFIGHTAGAGAPDPLSFPKGVEQPVAAALAVFRTDLAAVEARVAQAVTVPLKQHEFDALVSFDFNTGGIFRARLVALLNSGDRAGAAAAFDGWRKPPEIAGRRNAEKVLFRDGVYSKRGKASVYPANAAGKVLWSRGRIVDALELLRAPVAGGAAGAAPAPAPQPTRTPPPIAQMPPPRQPDDPGTDEATPTSSAFPGGAAAATTGVTGGGLMAADADRMGVVFWIGAGFFAVGLLLGLVAFIRNRNKGNADGTP